VEKQAGKQGITWEKLLIKISLFYRFIFPHLKNCFFKIFPKTTQLKLNLKIIFNPYLIIIMNIIILQEKLKEGVNIIGRVSSKSLTLPILKNILIRTEKNFLNLLATDLETGISWWGLAKIEESGEITVPAAIFSDFLNLLPNKQIVLSTKDQTLSFECENYKTRIKGNSAEEFPIVPQISKNEFIIFNCRSFCRGLEQVVDIASPITARPEISGIYLSIRKDLLRMAATDSFRLGEKVVVSEKPVSAEKEYSLIIPQKTVREVINIFGEKEGDLRIYLTANQILFELLMEETEHPQINLFSRLIEGEYPNYQEIIPKEFDTQIILQKEEFFNKLKAASLFSGKVNEVHLKIDPKKEDIEITSQNPETGEFNTVLGAKIKGKEINVSFDCRFLMDGLVNIKSAEVFFGLNSDAKEEIGPGVIRPVGDQSYIYVVMPIKTV